MFGSKKHKAKFPILSDPYIDSTGDIWEAQYRYDAIDMQLASHNIKELELNQSVELVCDTQKANPRDIDSVKVLSSSGVLIGFIVTTGQRHMIFDYIAKDEHSYNLILTGTPITNSPLDFFSQYKFLDERIFGGSFYGFRSYYAILGGYQNHQIVGYKHLAELVEKAHAIAYRIKIDEAVELPEFVDEIRPVKLEKKAQQIYDGISKDSYAELIQCVYG